MKHKISVIITTWNNEKDIELCLQSIKLQSFKDFNVIVVDNNSSDKTTEIIKAKFPEVKILQLTTNRFLTGGNNAGIKYAMEKYSPEFIMVLNPDTQLSANLLEVLYSTIIKDEKYGAVGPKVKFFNNEAAGKINSAGLIYDGFMQAYDRGFDEKDHDQFSNTEEVFGVSGVCILYRTQMLKEIGLYWDKIKMYLDEVELFIRAHKAEWNVIYVGKTSIEHSYMKSSNANKNLDVEKQKKKAWLLIALRHYSLKGKIAMLKNYFFN